MTTRLLSPEKRRIYPNNRSGAGRSPATDESKHCDYLLRSGLRIGQPDDLTWTTLKASGWTEYKGDAQVDERGYVLTDASGKATGDPSVVPNPWPTSQQGRPF